MDFADEGQKISQTAGLEPARAEPSGFRVHPLNRLGTSAGVGRIQKLEMQGIDPCTSRMLSERSTI